jgi:diguanylate cyclase (GGDEF)-like protein
MPEPRFGGRETTDLGDETSNEGPAADLARTALAVIDRDLKVVYANRAFEHLGLDLARDDVLLAATGRRLGTARSSTTTLAAAIRTGWTFAGEWRRVDDQAKWMPVVVEPVPGHERGRAVVSILDVDAWSIDGRPLTAGQLDAVTGLCTRESFLRVLERVCVDDRSTRTPIGVLFADLDEFKQINDRYGHLVGDRALASVARSLTGSVRPDDLVARFGGDEFVVLCRTFGPADTTGLAERIHRAIRDSEPMIGLSASLGIAVGAPPLPAASLLDAADQAMYRAKREGPGRTEITSVVAHRSA